MAKKMWMVFCVILMGLAMQTFAQPETGRTGMPKKTDGWVKTFEQAKAEAKQWHQPIFVLFTGSDWCPWCVKLEKEALATKDFKEFAKENLILFKVDYLRKQPASAEQKKKVIAFMKKFKVGMFPTVLLMNAEEKTLGRTGYQKGGGKKYVEHLKGLFKKAGLPVAEAVTLPVRNESAEKFLSISK